MSKGQDLLASLMAELLSEETVTQEHYLGEGLYLDVYCKNKQLGAEFHGRQHFEFSKYFYERYADFEEAQKRDERKIELCKELGISLAVFTYKEELTFDLVYHRVMEAISFTPSSQGKKPQTYEEKQKERARDYRKQAYRRWKQQNKKTT